MKHSHYFKPIPPGATHIDVYRVLEMFGVTDPCLQHAAKKLLVAGGRGPKDIARDIQEAIDTLQRRMEMWNEDSICGQPPLCDCDVACEKPDGVRCRSKLAGRVVPDDGWIEWGGGGVCPVPIGTSIEVRHRSGNVFQCKAGFGYSQSWSHSRVSGDIVAYRLVPSGS